MLLLSVNEKCRPQLLNIYGGGYFEKMNKLQFLVGYIFKTCTDTSRVANLLQPNSEGIEVSSGFL